MATGKCGVVAQIWHLVYRHIWIIKVRISGILLYCYMKTKFNGDWSCVRSADEGLWAKTSLMFGDLLHTNAHSSPFYLHLIPHSIELHHQWWCQGWHYLQIYICTCTILTSLFSILLTCWAPVAQCTLWMTPSGWSSRSTRAEALWGKIFHITQF